MLVFINFCMFLCQTVTLKALIYEVFFCALVHIHTGAELLVLFSVF